MRAGQGPHGDRHPRGSPPSPPEPREGAARGLRSRFVPFVRSLRPPSGATDLRQARSGLREPMDTAIPTDTPVLPDSPSSLPPVGTAWYLHLKGKGTSSRLRRTPTARWTLGPGPSQGSAPASGMGQDPTPEPAEPPGGSCHPLQSPPGRGVTPSPLRCPRRAAGSVRSLQERAGKRLQPWRRAGIEQIPSSPLPVQPQRGCSCQSRLDFKPILDILEPMGAQGISREGGGVDTPRARTLRAGGSWWLCRGGRVTLGTPPMSPLSRDIPSPLQQNVPPNVLTGKAGAEPWDFLGNFVPRSLMRPKILTPPAVKNERQQRQQRGWECFYWIQDTHDSPRGGFCTVTGKRWGIKAGFGEFLRGFPFTQVQIPAAALAQPGMGPSHQAGATFTDQPGEGWKTKPPQLQGLSQCMSSHGSVEPQGLSLLPSFDLDPLECPGRRGDTEAGPSRREGVRAAVVPEENPRLIHWTHPRWETSPASWLQLPAAGRQCWEQSLSQREAAARFEASQVFQKNDEKRS